MNFHSWCAKVMSPTTALAITQTSEQINAVYSCSKFCQIQKHEGEKKRKKACIPFLAGFSFACSPSGSLPFAFQ